MNTRMFLSVVLALGVLITGCKSRQATPPYSRALPEGQLALRKITDPADIPDFIVACSDLGGLRQAIHHSLNYLSKPSSRGFYPYGEITHEQAAASLEVFSELLDGSRSPAQLNQAIREQFDVYISVGWDDKGTVLFTGYYTPIFDGSPVQTGRFQFPLYRMPDDLVKGDQGEILGRRLANGQISPYPSRAELENSTALHGKELMWLADPFAVYIAHVQGSAKIRLPDGQLQTVGYAANNGHDYHSIAEELIKDRKISRAKMSLAAMIDYFKTHTRDVSEYVSRNPRFVFFRHESGAPRGSLNEPVTRMRTIATDKAIYPRGGLTMIATQLPRLTGVRIAAQPYTGFAMDQDTGGAIRAPGRCDVYMGQGALAGKMAGQTYQEGKLYYLFLKPAFLATPILVQQVN